MTNIKLAIPFQLNNELNDKVSEFNIIFDKNKNSLEKLIEFIQEYPNTRINIACPAGIHVATLSSLNKVSDNVYIKLSGKDIRCVEELREKECKFFLDSSLPVINYTHLDAYCKIGVSDVYIADDLCYNLEEVKEHCDSKNIKLRLVLNRIPATSFDAGINCCSPIFRPQDLALLDSYFDIFEFDCGMPYDWGKFKVLYRAWFEQQKWNGDLREINSDLQFYFPNASIIKDLTKYKTNCGRCCSSRFSSFCHKCKQFTEIGLLLDSKGVRVKQNKKK